VAGTVGWSTHDAGVGTPERQPPFPLGSGGSQIGQLNPLYDITGGFSKEAQRMVDRLVKEMGVEGRKSAYESVLQPGAVKRLSMKNDPVFFLDELTKVFTRHPNWTMPKDQLNGTAPASPQRDGLSDMRVAVFMRLLPDSSMVKMAFANNHSTRVPTIDGREVVKLAKELTITEWMRVFLRETTISETSKVAAQHTLERLEVESGEGWAVAARVVLLHKRAAMVDPNRPFLVEEDYFWKVLSETDAMGICRRIVGMVAPHDTDKFEAPLYDVQAQWESLRAFPVNTGQLLDRTMELRGRKACDTCEAATSATRRYLPQRKPGARKPRFLRLAARQADGPRGMRAACGTSSGSGTCVVDTTKTRKGLKRAERAGEIRRIPGNVMGPYQVTGRENSDRSSALPHSQRIPCLNPMPQETKVNRQMRRTPLIAR